MTFKELKKFYRKKLNLELELFRLRGVPLIVGLEVPKEYQKKTKDGRPNGLQRRS